MKYYVLIGNMVKRPAEIPNFKGLLNEHHAYLKDYKDKGDVLLSGPKKEGFGGIILIRTDKDPIQSFIDNDPFVKSGIQEYEVTPGCSTSNGYRNNHQKVSPWHGLSRNRDADGLP